MKTILKLVIAALVIHATYRAGVVYMRYYEFKDDVTQIAQFGVRRTDNELKTNVLDAARRREIPLSPDAVTVTRANHHIIVDARYLEQVELAPRYFYPWTANVHVDVLTLVLQEAK
jgi:hypothetical protein